MFPIFSLASILRFLEREDNNNKPCGWHGNVRYPLKKKKQLLVFRYSESNDHHNEIFIKKAIRLIISITVRNDKISAIFCRNIATFIFFKHVFFFIHYYNNIEVYRYLKVYLGVLRIGYSVVLIVHRFYGCILVFIPR